MSQILTYPSLFHQKSLKEIDYHLGYVPETPEKSSFIGSASTIGSNTDLASNKLLI